MGTGECMGLEGGKGGGKANGSFQTLTTRRWLFLLGRPTFLCFSSCSRPPLFSHFAFFSLSLLPLNRPPPPNNSQQTVRGRRGARPRQGLHPTRGGRLGRPVVIITVRKHHKNGNAAALARLKRFICWVFDVAVAKATGVAASEDGGGSGEEVTVSEGGAGAAGGDAGGGGRRRATPLGDGKLTAIFDLRGASMDNMDVAGLKQIFGLLQSHFPERLGRMIFLDPPVIFWGVWRVVSPFVDPVTRAKVVMASLRDLGDGSIVPLRVLPEDMGGESRARSVVEAASEMGLLPRDVDVAALAAEAGEQRRAARSASASPEKRAAEAGEGRGGRAAAGASAAAAVAFASRDDNDEDEDGQLRGRRRRRRGPAR